MDRDSNLVWIDLEMTGLEPEVDTIMEIATVVTDANLNLVAEGPVLAIQHDQDSMDAMGEWCRLQHGRSGLTQRCLGSEVTVAQAQKETLAFLEGYVSAGKSPMCGNSICQDRRFLYRYMPELCNFFHYRNLDVSTLKELCQRWQPQLAAKFSKRASHLALDDIYDSIAELKFYRAHFIRECND
jgi:oligoribonuclease